MKLDFNALDLLRKKPELYEKGDSVIWTDDHISEQLLHIHLNSEVDLASRTEQSIDQTIDFILQFCNKKGMRILDLGCGPGLYAEKLAEAGHKVTGVDFSERSISYAVNEAKNKALDIEYLCQDYRSMEFNNEFDLVLLIYTDLGVLIPNERDTVLINIHNALRQNGLFIFDVINAENVEKKFEEKRNWNYESSGFWSDIPHLELSEGFHYPENKVFLQQHIIIDQKENLKLYRFWTHYFEDRDISRILSDRGFINVKTYRDVLPSTNIWNGENISFYKSSKF